MRRDSSLVAGRSTSFVLDHNFRRTLSGAFVSNECARGEFWSAYQAVVDSGVEMSPQRLMDGAVQLGMQFRCAHESDPPSNVFVATAEDLCRVVEFAAAEDMKSAIPLDQEEHHVVKEVLQNRAARRSSSLLQAARIEEFVSEHVDRTRRTKHRAAVPQSSSDDADWSLEDVDEFSKSLVLDPLSTDAVEAAEPTLDDVLDQLPQELRDLLLFRGGSPFDSEGESCADDKALSGSMHSTSNAADSALRELLLSSSGGFGMTRTATSLRTTVRIRKHFSHLIDYSRGIKPRELLDELQRANGVLQVAVESRRLSLPTSEAEANNANLLEMKSQQTFHEVEARVLQCQSTLQRSTLLSSEEEEQLLKQRDGAEAATEHLRRFQNSEELFVNRKQTTRLLRFRESLTSAAPSSCDSALDANEFQMVTTFDGEPQPHDDSTDAGGLLLLPAIRSSDVPGKPPLSAARLLANSSASRHARTVLDDKLVSRSRVGSATHFSDHTSSTSREAPRAQTPAAAPSSRLRSALSRSVLSKREKQLLKCKRLSTQGLSRVLESTPEEVLSLMPPESRREAIRAISRQSSSSMSTVPTAPTTRAQSPAFGFRALSPPPGLPLIVIAPPADEAASLIRDSAATTPHEVSKPHPHVPPRASPYATEDGPMSYLTVECGAAGTPRRATTPCASVETISWGCPTPLLSSRKKMMHHRTSSGCGAAIAPPPNVNPTNWERWTRGGRPR